MFSTGYDLASEVRDLNAVSENIDADHKSMISHCINLGHEAYQLMLALLDRNSG